MFFSRLRTRKEYKRAFIKYKLFQEFIEDSDASIVDVGSGTGYFSEILQNQGYQITAVDVVDRSKTDKISTIVYDGRDLPFQPNSHDIGMLITVLHHCKDPDYLLKEVVRISKKRLFILEDVYSNAFMKYITWFADSLANFEFIGHPHTNKTETEWERCFEHLDLKLIFKKKVKVLFIFTQVIYILECPDANQT